MATYWAIVLVIVALAFISAGGYMLYSALTGKGIPPILFNESPGLWVQYKLRGIIGVTFIIGGLAILTIFFKHI